MPRLSIIVPHLLDDSGLETTVLSVLENRNDEVEVLIAHDGSYTDPYALGQDEAILIESDAGSCPLSQVNLAIASACSPLVQVLLPGMRVESQWYSEALKLMADSNVAVVCSPIADSDSQDVYFGLSRDSLPHRRTANTPKSAGSPLLGGCVLRKRSWKIIGGWLENSTREIAEVEFGLLAAALELEVAVAREVTIVAPRRVGAGNEPGYEIGRACGQLACAYASIEESGVQIDSLARRLGHLASGLMSPKTVAERLGWVMGIRDRSLVREIQNRYTTAVELLSESPAHQNTATQSRRRAA